MSKQLSQKRKIANIKTARKKAQRKVKSRIKAKLARKAQ
jgi:hypothetical protein